MPRTKRTPPKYPDRFKGERNLDLPRNVLSRIPRMLAAPGWLAAHQWRTLVQKIPAATDCRETLISYLVNLDWKIEPVESDQRDEMKEEIEYYTELFKDNGQYDYVSTIEWVAKDALDLPFGGACEVGREGDLADGRVAWYRLLDGGTLFPTLNKDFPVGQRVEGVEDPVYFPNYAINRLYYSPSTNIRLEGWGVAPPEKIYLALDLVSRGDQYYANMFMDTPEAGILDLGDMSQASAEAWIEGFQDMMGGIDPYKVGVIYQHNTTASWIPFTRSPQELMFDKGYQLYVSLVCAGYGMTPGDISLPTSSSGGDTLAGSIRGERKTKRSGFATLKNKVKLFYDRMLPEGLEFKFIDLDEESILNLGRARLANATSLNTFITAGVLSPQEARLQLIADGLVSISIPEDIPEDAISMLDRQPAERPNELGRPVTPSSGGWGETTTRGHLLVERIAGVKGVDDLLLRRLAYAGEQGAIEVLEATHWRASFEDGGNTLPETIKSDAALSVIRSMIDGDDFWYLEVDDELVDDLDWLLRDAWASDVADEIESMYVRGEIEEIDGELNLPTPDKEKIREFALEVPEKLKATVARGIHNGVFHYLLINKDADNSDIINNDTGIVREHLDASIDKFIVDTLALFTERFIYEAVS